MLEVDRGIRAFGSAESLLGSHFHGDHIWDPLRLCNHCQDDWESDIYCDDEIFREAELLHAENEYLADEVLGRSMERSPRPSADVVEVENSGTLRSKSRSKRRSSILGLLAK